MKYLKFILFNCILVLFTYSSVLGQPLPKGTKSDQLMVRIAEIEIDPEYLEEYLSILKEEAAASVRLEPGVICIYPMYEKEKPSLIRLLEIYSNPQAYEAHLQTPHFRHYKTATLPMVKALRLVDMEAIDPQTMPDIFFKLNR